MNNEFGTNRPTAEISLIVASLVIWQKSGHRLHPNSTLQSEADRIRRVLAIQESGASIEQFDTLDGEIWDVGDLSWSRCEHNESGITLGVDLEDVDPLVGLSASFISHVLQSDAGVAGAVSFWVKQLLTRRGKTENNSSAEDLISEIIGEQQYAQNPGSTVACNLAQLIGFSPRYLPRDANIYGYGLRANWQCSPLCTPSSIHENLDQFIDQVANKFKDCIIYVGGFVLPDNRYHHESAHLPKNSILFNHHYGPGEFFTKMVGDEGSINALRNGIGYVIIKSLPQAECDHLWGKGDIHNPRYVSEHFRPSSRRDLEPIDLPPPRPDEEELPF